MALIKCPGCGKKMSDKVSSCPKCGYPTVGWGNVATESSKSPKKKFAYVTIVIGVIIVFVIGIACMFLLINRNKPAKEAMKIIIEDKGKKVSFDRIYYNSSENACVVYFNNGKVDDVAVVLLNSREVGYQNLYNLSVLGMAMAKTEEQKQKIAQQMISDPYDPVYVYEVENGKETWKLIYR
ncbi:MAG: zinc ribbon domain-containing protein [Lachnospiraceae bacterium]|nr:zinc ribbon domain-containing protein [Lachnospiraceae bacterium]